MLCFALIVHHASVTNLWQAAVGSGKQKLNKLQLTIENSLQQK